MTLLEMKQEQKTALNTADAIITAVENRGTPMTASEEENYNTAMNKFKSLASTVKAREEQNTIRAFFPKGMPGVELPVGAADAQPTGFQNGASLLRMAETRKPEYAKALHAFLCTGGKAHNEELIAGADGAGGYCVPGSELFTRQRLANGSVPSMNAATYEGTPDGGSGPAGGYAVNVPTVQQVVPLALPDLGIFDASMVIPTATAIRIPQQVSFGTSAIKAESTGTLATFGGTDPTLGQLELDAWMAGGLRWVSWELLQDVEMWQQFVVDDLLKGQRILEDSLFATGTGASQPQGVFGNTGTGTGTAYELTGAAADGQTLLDSLFDVTSTLKGAYQANASWIMSRATGLAIRRAQMQANLFVPVATVDPDGTERILGKPL